MWCCFKAPRAGAAGTGEGEGPLKVGNASVPPLWLQLFDRLASTPRPQPAAAPAACSLQLSPGWAQGKEGESAAGWQAACLGRVGVAIAVASFDGSTLVWEGPKDAQLDILGPWRPSGTAQDVHFLQSLLKDAAEEALQVRGKIYA